MSSAIFPGSTVQLKYILMQFINTWFILSKLVAVGKLLATNKQQPVLLHICNLLTALTCLSQGPTLRTYAVSVIPTTRLQQNYPFVLQCFPYIIQQLLAILLEMRLSEVKNNPSGAELHSR